ncbi:MAG: transposase [Lachnospiraceae bacterium]|nr:transposase [Lachnospiraceae bacterium]
MKQQTFADVEYSHRKRKTKREQFLNTMDRLIPWEYWVDEIRPYYAKGRRGRPPRGIELMLRMHLLKTWFSLSESGLEDAIYDSYAMREFMHIDFLNQQVPSAATLRRFRRLLKKNKIDEMIFADIDERLKAAGLSLRIREMTDVSVARTRKA